MKKNAWIFLSLLFVGLGCNRSALQVQKEWMTKESLASSWVGSPDPRQESPPNGQKLIVSWDFPGKIFVEELQLVLTVRFWNGEERVFVENLEKKEGWKEYCFPYNLQEPEGKILTYRVVAKNLSGAIVANWEHQFWRERISVDQIE